MITQLLCLNDDWGEFPEGCECNMLPRKGGIYTLVSVFGPGESINFNRRTMMDKPMVAFDEIHFLNRLGRPCFAAEMFRPVKSPSIQRFYDILKDPNAPIPD